MKAFTSIEQSKKLAEILPLESADMSYRPYREEGGIPDYQPDLCAHKFASWIGFPFWSLAALLDVLIYPHIEQNYMGQWFCRVEQQNTTYLWEGSNPVDACYEMILKLHEQNML